MELIDIGANLGHEISPEKYLGEFPPASRSECASRDNACDNANDEQGNVCTKSAEPVPKIRTN